ncbi:hypothetical protein [Pontimicrobium sp. SW4]|uniref:Uncharacterized protein n=1 Tax=Pontimicrobium sp. SW4 TaxID=3153519 RepID=A0AAU7BQ83_9FLAO
MTITLKKSTTKSSILTIVRSDGSSTWSKLHRGLETHDLAHYAVESTLKFNKAFYGIINDGYTVADFELPKEQRPFAVRVENLHPDAIITEHIVNMLEVELLNSGFNDHFIEALKNILKVNNLEFPNNLNENTLKQIRTTYHKLYNQWLALTDDQELKINFQP